MFNEYEPYVNEMNSYIFNIVKEEDLYFHCEMNSGLIFLHIEIYKNSPAVLKSVLRRWKILKEDFKKQGVESVYVYSPNRRFVKFMKDFHYLNNFVYEGQFYEVFECHLQ